MDIKRLLNHYEMGAPYYGDVKQDTIEVIKSATKYDESFDELDEIKTAFCSEDEFGEIIGLIKDIIEARMTKKAMLSDLGKLLEMVESKQLELSRQGEYGCELINSVQEKLNTK